MTETLNNMPRAALQRTAALKMAAELLSATNGAFTGVAGKDMYAFTSCVTDLATFIMTGARYDDLNSSPLALLEAEEAIEPAKYHLELDKFKTIGGSLTTINSGSGS